MTEHDVQVRWLDLDGLGHVNHSVVLTYLEEGRDAFLAKHGIRREEYVVGSCSVDFKDEIDPAQRSVRVQCELGDLGTKSIRTRERIRTLEGKCLVEAEFTIVLWDPTQRESREITEAERDSLAATALEGSHR